MKLSVIVPSYKPQFYTWECLDSVCNQTINRSQYEVIVVLNGCNEPYNSELKRYLDEHPEVNWNYIQTDTPGVSNARNIGIDNAKGEYITFLDDDDYVSPSYIEHLLEASSPTTIGLAHPKAFNSEGFCPYVIEEAYNGISERGCVHYLKARKVFQGPCMKLFHRDIIGKRRFDVSFKNGEDALYMFLLSNKFKSVKASNPEAIYYRRVRENSATFAKQKLSYRLSNSFRIIIEYSKIYWRNLSSYSTSFYLTRVLGAIRMAMN